MKKMGINKKDRLILGIIVLNVIILAATAFMMQLFARDYRFLKTELAKSSKRQVEIREGLAAVLNRHAQEMNRMHARFENLHSEVARISDRVEGLRESRFADMLDRVTSEAKNDRERCIAVARHLAASVRNDSPAPGLGAGDPIGLWEKRQGLCGERAVIMLEALSRLNIRAATWNIYDYPFGHTCVQVFYDGGWHFYDPTYGGYFTDEKGRVLSWDKIVENPQKAIARMVVFKRTLDVNVDGRRVNNNERMKAVYSGANLSAVTCAGEPRSKIFDLPVFLDLAGGLDKPLTVGKADHGSTDMRQAAVQSQVRCFYFDVLGSVFENFQYRLLLAGLTQGRPVRITFTFCGPSSGNARLEASTSSGKILEGATGPVCREAKTWSIVYEPLKTGEHTIHIRLSNYGAKSYASIDHVIVEKAR